MIAREEAEMISDNKLKNLIDSELIILEFAIKYYAHEGHKSFRRKIENDELKMEIMNELSCNYNYDVEIYSNDNKWIIIKWD